LASVAAIILFPLSSGAEETLPCDPWPLAEEAGTQAAWASLCSVSDKLLTEYALRAGNEVQSCVEKRGMSKYPLIERYRKAMNAALEKWYRPPMGCEKFLEEFPSKIKDLKKRDF
jgi:hypothetical protein